ncbi:MAG: GlsB/YeaQ/YmgE family stress response membrane protein [Bacteroides sp.]
MGIILSILIGALSGYIAGNLMKGGGLGFLWNLILGILGGVVGGWVFGLLGLHTNGGIIGSLITSVVGAVLLLYVAKLIARK